MLAWIALGLMACERTPAFVDRADIDNAFTMGRVQTVCKGLEMEEPKVQYHATIKLKTMKESPEAVECVCAQAIDPQSGQYREQILRGLAESSRDDMVSCFLPALKDTRTKDPLSLILELSETTAPVVHPALLEFAMDSSREAEHRKQALEYLKREDGDEVTPEIMTLVRSEKDEVVRAAAASELGGSKDPEVLSLLTEASEKDSSGKVRISSLLALKRSKVEGVDDKVCEAMLQDEDPEVRRRAVLSYKGTKREGAIQCLRKKAMALEKESSVRSAMLKVLQSSPHDGAAKILCDAIPFWVRSYVKKLAPHKAPGTDIIKAQNNRDWENSYNCVARAYSSGGYSCKGQQYVGFWFKDLGNEGAFAPKCPGDPE